MFDIKKSKRIVIKVGTSSLTSGHSCRLNDDFIQKLVDQIVKLKKAGHEVVLVSSGAILAGMEVAKLSSRPTEICELQRLSSLGQPYLMIKYSQAFQKHNIAVGQVLLTAADIKSIERGDNFVNLINCLLLAGNVPIINENDATAVQEIKIGDNDTLAANTAVMIKSDLLIILSDIDGLYDRDPSQLGAKLIREVNAITEDVKQMSGQNNRRGLGTGGMQTKLSAAEICLQAKLPMILMNAKKFSNWPEVFDSGTLFIDKA